MNSHNSRCKTADRNLAINKRTSNTRYKPRHPIAVTMLWAIVWFLQTSVPAKPIGPCTHKVHLMSGVTYSSLRP